MGTLILQISDVPYLIIVTFSTGYYWQRLDGHKKFFFLKMFNFPIKDPQDWVYVKLGKNMSQRQ